MTESQNIEWKSSWRDEHLKWVCGFANASGGRLYIGVDNVGNVVGIDNHTELLEQLPNKFRDILGVYGEMNLHVETGKHYIEIIVPRYDVPISLRGKYYVRSGSTLQELKGPALTAFILRRTGKTWDDIVEERAVVGDIDPQTIQQFIRDTRKAKRIAVEDDISTPDLLDKLRLREDGKLKRAAIVLFGKDPARFYSNFSVKIGRFGSSDSDLRFHEVVEGNLIQLKDRVAEMLNAKFFIHPIDFVGMQRIERNEYPVAAVREMILNALVHRNYMGAQTQIRQYDAHFSVWNDGGLPEGITEDDLRKTHRSKPRNPVIADVCFKAGYIDAWGRGTIRIIEACREAALPEPVLREEQGGFLSQVFKANTGQQTVQSGNNVLADLREKYGRSTGEVREKYGRNAEAILAWMHYRHQVTLSEIAQYINTSLSTVEKAVKKLSDDGIVKRVGPTKSGYWEVHLEKV